MVRDMIGEQCGRLHEDKIWGNRNPEWPRGSMNGVTACFLLSLICETFPVPQPPRNGRSIGVARRTLPQGGLAEAAYRWSRSRVRTADHRDKRHERSFT